MNIFFESEIDYSYDFSPEDLALDCMKAVLNHLQCPYDCEVSVTLVSKDRIHEINKEFRNVDAPTDVLSFPMMNYDGPGDFSSDDFAESTAFLPEGELLNLGDVILCDEVLQNQAKEYGHSMLREFAFLTVHSLLHLCGFDHMEEDERIEMEAKQKEIMNELNILR